MFLVQATEATVRQGLGWDTSPTILIDTHTWPPEPGLCHLEGDDEVFLLAGYCVVAGDGKVPTGKHFPGEGKLFAGIGSLQ